MGPCLERQEASTGPGVRLVLALVAGEAELAVELLELLDVHPAVAAGDARQELVHVLVRQVARVLRMMNRHRQWSQRRR